MGRNFWNPFKKRHHSHKHRHGFLGGLKKVAKKVEHGVEKVVKDVAKVVKEVEEDVVDVFEGKEPENLPLKHIPIPFFHKPHKPHKIPTIPVEPEAPVKPRAPPKKVVTIQQADDIHNRKVLNNELQALEDVEEKQEDLLGRMATKLDPPVSMGDFIKDLGEFASKQAQEEYLEENFSTLSKLGSVQIQTIMSVLG